MTELTKDTAVEPLAESITEPTAGLITSQSGSDNRQSAICDAAHVDRMGAIDVGDANDATGGTGGIHDQAGVLEPILLDASILAGQLAPSSISKYRQDFSAYVKWCRSPERVTRPASLARWRAHLANETDLSPATINRMISAVKRIMKEAAAQGYLDADSALAFGGVAGVKPQALKSRQRLHARTRISPADMRRLCSAPDVCTSIGKRDAALLATLASSGLRVAELVGLQIGSLSQRGGGYFVAVRGKNDIEPREAPLSKEAYQLIKEWLAARHVGSPFLFTSFAGRGREDNPASRAQARALTTVAAWQIVQRYAKVCGLEHIKPHDFRRFVGTQLATRDIRKAQKALGHKRIDTTARHYVLDDLDPGLTDNLY